MRTPKVALCAPKASSAMKLVPKSFSQEADVADQNSALPLNHYPSLPTKPCQMLHYAPAPPSCALQHYKPEACTLQHFKHQPCKLRHHAPVDTRALLHRVFGVKGTKDLQAFLFMAYLASLICATIAVCIAKEETRLWIVDNLLDLIETSIEVAFFLPFAMVVLNGCCAGLPDLYSQMNEVDRARMDVLKRTMESDFQQHLHLLSQQNSGAGPVIHSPAPTSPPPTATHEVSMKKVDGSEVLRQFEKKERARDPKEKARIAIAKERWADKEWLEKERARVLEWLKRAASYNWVLGRPSPQINLD